MTGWFAAVWVVALAPHIADVVAQVFRRRESTDLLPSAANAASASPSTKIEHDEEDVTPLPPGRSYRSTLGCVGLIWIAFAFSTFSRPLLGGTPRTPEALFGEQTPLKLTEWLVKNPPQGQVFNPQYWGDWLGFAGPKPMALFADTNMHLTPPTVWKDYRRIFDALSGWENTLDRYNVKTLIVDRAQQPQLVRNLRTSTDWVLVYDDPQSMVLRRKSTQPTAAPAATPAAKH
jgi:hypothetical protein